MLPSRKKKLSICKECKKASTPAINAAKLGHTDCLVTAYRQLGVFNERDNYGATPIHFASRNGKLECLQWLVERSGISPNAVTMNGNTAAHDAAATGHVDCLEYLLLNTKCSITDANAEGATVLHVACRFGQKEVVQWLVEKAKCPLNSKGANDVTAVHLCAAKNHLGCLKWLTAHQDYTPNEKTVHGATPVYFAAQEGSLECLQWLIEQGRGHAYQTALDGMAPIHAAAQAGQKACLEYMVKYVSVSVRCRADDGATPAHFAAASGQVECLEWILNNGGSVLDRDNLGGTPVHDAAEQGQVKTLTYLMEHGVDVNTKDNEGLKPVDLAKENNHQEAYQLLFKVARPKLLTSMEPDHSLSRASGLTEEQKEIMRAEEKQKFEAMIGSNSTPENDQGMEQPLESSMTAQSAQDSMGAASPVSMAAASSDHGHSSAMDRQQRRTSVGLYKSLDFQKESSPDVDDINAAILKTMETHEVDTETDKGIVPRMKAPKSPSLPEAGRQPPQKKSIFSFFSSPPKIEKTGRKPTDRKSRGKDHVDMGVQKTIPAAAVESPSSQNAAEEGQGISPGVEGGPKLTKAAKKKVRKRRVVKQSKSPKSKQGLQQKDNAGDEISKAQEMREQPPSPLPLSSAHAQQPVPVIIRKPKPKEVNISKAPEIGEQPSSSPLPVASAQPQQPGSKPKPIPTKKVSKSKAPEMRKQSSSPLPVASDQPQQPGSVVINKPKPSPTKKIKPIEAPSTPIEMPKEPQKDRVDEKRPMSGSEQKSPVTGATPKRVSAQKRHVKRRPVSSSSRRHPASSSAPRQPVSSSKKRPPPSKKQRPVSAGAGVRRFSIDKILTNIRERNVKDNEESGIFHSVSNFGFQEDDKLPTEVAHEEIGETMAGDLVQGLLTDLAKDSDSKVMKPKTPEAVAEELVQAVLKEALKTSDAKLSSDNSQGDAHFIPAPPPPPPLMYPPSPPYVFTVDKRAEEESTEIMLGQEKDAIGQALQENVAPVEKSMEISYESFIISFVTAMPEERDSEHGSSDESGSGQNLDGKVTDESKQLLEMATSEEQAKEGRLKEKVITHKEKLEMEQAMLRRKRESVRSSWEERWLYRGPLEHALYLKIHEFQKQRVERGYTDVLKKADDFQASSSTTSFTDSDTDKEEKSEGRGGHLSDRLKMFGGAASFVKATPPKEKKKTKKVAKVERPDANDQTATEVEMDKSQPKPMTVDKDTEADSSHVEPALPRHFDSEVPDSKSVIRGSSPRRRSSSCVSISAFETIEEESQSNVEESTESLDKVAPLPRIGPSLSRRQSTELLRLDGMLKLDTESALNDQERARGSNKVSASSLGESSLVHLSSRGLEREESRPSVDAKAIYMNSANLPHINKERDECKKKELDRIKGVVNGLISVPHSTDFLQLKFQGLNADYKPKIQIWQYNDRTIRLIPSIKVVDFGPTKIYMFFQVQQNGPLLFHIYLWLGLSISRQRLDGIYEHVQNLIHSLPGKTVIHREFYGYESLDFHRMLGPVGIKQLTSHHTSTTSYLNPELGWSSLVVYSDGAFKIVETEKCSYKYISSSENPLILNSPRGVYIWLPESYWAEQLKGRQELVLNISEKFISIHSLPKWTPVVAMTQDAEVPSFCDHFPDWVMNDLSSTHESSKLRLPGLKPPKITYPVTGQLKVWTLVKNELQATGMADLGRFYSDQVHVVHYSYPKQSALYTWMEGVVYIWLGAAVQTDRDQILKQLGEKLPAVISIANLPTVIVPEGLEPSELLYLFKGKFIVQKSSNPQGSQLYKLSGHNAMSIKTEEVPVHASSLHSCHTFCLVVAGRPTCVWAGQFAEKTLRRAALVMAKSVSRSKQILVMAEGLEIKDFWQNLGGTGTYDQFSRTTNVDYLPARLYSASTTHNNTAFTELNTTKKEELDTKTCYVLVYRDQILIRVRKEYDKRQLVPTEIVKSYILQHGGFKMENDFVMTVVHERIEGEIFWKWFSFQESSLPQETSDSKNEVLEEAKQNDNEVDGGQDIHGKVTSDSSDVQAMDVVEGNETDSTALQLPKEVAIFAELNKTGLSPEKDKAKYLEKMANETTEELHDMISDIMVFLGDPPTSSSPATPPSSEVPKASFESKAESAEVTSANAESLIKQDEALLTEKTTDQERGITKRVQVSSPKKKRSTPAVPMVDLTVFIPELDQTLQIRVKESANILSVIFKAAETGGCKVKEYYAIFETYEALKMQRALEDHEIIKDVMALWPKQKAFQPILALKIFPTKNQLWTKSTPIPKERITAWTKDSVPPDVGMKLYHLKRGSSKQKWVQERYVMLKSGMSCDEERAHRRTSSCGLDYALYVPFNDHGKVDRPTPFCFIMKPPNQWKEKDMKMYCTPDAKTLSQWIHAVRLMKHGLQLKGNYLAMKKRIDAITAKELLKESTALGL